MKERLFRVLKWIAFPAFYLFALGIFGYLKFPYDRLKDRLVMEIEKRGKPGQRLEIQKLTSYWFTGVELTGVKLRLPPDETPNPGADFGMGGAPAKETVLAIDEAHVRVRILPLLLGRVRLDFWASAFGGEIKGTVPVGSGQDVDLELDKIELGKVDAIAQSIGVPIRGTATGKLALTAPEGKFNKANGTFDLTIAGAVVSDGKTKIQGLIELPPAKLGDIVFTAEAKDGVLKVTKLAATGTDLELVGDGKITLKEPWADAIADLYLRFKFTDAYRGKSSMTKTLLGEPGAAVGGLMESQVPKMKRAKRADGFYGWHVHGPLKKLKYDPSATDAAAAAPAPKRGKGADSPFGAAKRPTPGTLPLGASTAKPSPDEPAPEKPAAREMPPEIARPMQPPDPPSRRGAAAEVMPNNPMPVPPPAPVPAAPPEPAPAAPDPGLAPDQPAPVPEQPQ